MSQLVSDNAVQPRSLRPGWAERVLIRWLDRLQAGTLTVAFPSGIRHTFRGPQDGPRASLRIHDWRVVLRMLWSGDIGVAESYMAGEWDSPDLTALMTLGLHNETAWAALLSRSRLAALRTRLFHARRANTHTGSRRNIADHYDLGNGFYRAWLDDSMSYSSALFTDRTESHDAAQRRKYLRLGRQLDLQPGDTVLEIGCGWGGFAEIAAAEFGCRVVGLTLSKQQAAYARARMTKARLDERVEIRLQDYRDITGQFDKIVSIEMFEAVGEENWPRYFAALEHCLKPGGRAAVQVIAIDDAAFEGYRRNPDFIQRYIFPGGMLPSPERFEAAAARGGFAVHDAFRFGDSYAETLRRWHDAFVENWPRIATLGFDRRFHRLWRYYLSYCEAGFEYGKIDVHQYILGRD